MRPTVLFTIKVMPHRNLTSVPTAGIQVAGSRGESLPSGIMNQLEQSFQTDLSAIRVHRDPAANKVVNSMAARAFASGTHIYFAENQFDTEGVSGKRLLAHEVAHVIQQTKRSNYGSSHFQKTNYAQKVVDISGAGIPQCWAIPLSSTSDLPDITEILDHHQQVLPQILEPSTSHLINMMVMNHRQAVNQGTVPQFWAGMAERVINDTVHPVLGVQISHLNDQYVLSALYDALKAAGEYRAAGRILNLFPDVKTTFFSAETYNHFFEQNISNVDFIIEMIYSLWHEEPWFGNAKPRFMLDRTLAFFLNPSPGLSRQSISSSQRLTKAHAAIELARRHNFEIKETKSIIWRFT